MRRGYYSQQSNHENTRHAGLFPDGHMQFPDYGHWHKHDDEVGEHVRRRKDSQRIKRVNALGQEDTDWGPVP